MNIKTRVANLEKKTTGSEFTVFFYRPETRPAQDGEDGPQCIAVSFEVDGQSFTMKREAGETVEDLHRRMRERATELTGARFALAMHEDVKRL